MTLADIFKKIVKFVISIYASHKLQKRASKNGHLFALEDSDYVLSIEKLSAKFYLPLYKTEHIQRSIVAKGNYYEFETLHYMSDIADGGGISEAIKGNCVLDIGSNIGNHTLYFLLECGAGVVHCFEPVFETFSYLKRNIELNNLQDKCILHNEGVGAKTAKAKLINFEHKNMGSSELSYSNDGNIPIVAIDDMVFDSKIAFVKIDVEGFEREVLQGMQKTIERELPYMMVEIRNEYFDEIQEMLSTIGYWYIRMGNSLNYLYIPTRN